MSYGFNKCKTYIGMNCKRMAFIGSHIAYSLGTGDTPKGLGAIALLELV